MRTTELSITPNGGRLFVVRFSVVAAISILAITTAAIGTMAQPQETTVTVGNRRPVQYSFQIIPRTASASTQNPDIAEAWYDEANEVFYVRGVSPGTTTVTFTGSYQRILAGNRRPQAVPFTRRARVRVLPAVIRNDERTIAISVTRRLSRTYPVERLLGAVFGHPNQEGVTWRNVRLAGGDDDIARADLNRDRLTLTGVGSGRTTVTLRGERKVSGGWQPVIRYLNVSVGPR